MNEGLKLPALHVTHSPWSLVTIYPALLGKVAHFVAPLFLFNYRSCDSLSVSAVKQLLSNESLPRQPFVPVRWSL